MRIGRGQGKKTAKHLSLKPRYGLPGDPCYDGCIVLLWIEPDRFNRRKKAGTLEDAITELMDYCTRMEASPERREEIPPRRHPGDPLLSTQTVVYTRIRDTEKSHNQLESQVRRFGFQTRISTSIWLPSEPGGML